jgi:ATP-dependent Lon protease
MPGNGKLSDTGFGGGTAIKEELKEAVNYVRSNLNRVTQTAKFSDFEFHLKATDLNGIGNNKGLELAIFLSIVSSIAERALIPQLAILGSMSIGGAIIGSDNLGEYLQVASDSGAKKVLIPAVDMAQLGKVPADLISKFSLIIYSDPVDAAFKAMGLE